MTLASKIGLGIAALGTVGFLDAVEMAKADDVVPSGKWLEFGVAHSPGT